MLIMQQVVVRLLDGNRFAGKQFGVLLVNQFQFVVGLEPGPWDAQPVHDATDERRGVRVVWRRLKDFQGVLKQYRHDRRAFHEHLGANVHFDLVRGVPEHVLGQVRDTIIDQVDFAVL